jgi:hypothetical protein
MRHLSRLPAVLVMLAAGAGPLGAQDVGLVGVGVASENVELPDPVGFGAFVQFRSAPWLFRLSYLRYADETRKSGTVCQVYSPRIGCRTEGVATSARMGGLRAVAERSLQVARSLELGVGGGVSFNSLTVNATGESGFRADLYLPKTGQLGYLGSASLAFTPAPSLPVRLLAGITGHWVKFRGCVSAEDKTSGYAPFCGWDRFTEVHAGVSVTVPRASATAASRAEVMAGPRNPRRAR